jgi:hypothetical protein
VLASSNMARGSRGPKVMSRCRTAGSTADAWARTRRHRKASTCWSAGKRDAVGGGRKKQGREQEREGERERERGGGEAAVQKRQRTSIERPKNKSSTCFFKLYNKQCQSERKCALVKLF